MKEFEYLVKKMYGDDKMHTKFLNENSKLGWELVSVNSEPEKMGATAVYFFKRQISKSNSNQKFLNPPDDEIKKREYLKNEFPELIKSSVKAFVESIGGRVLETQSTTKQSENQEKFNILDWLKDELFTEQSLTQGIIDTFEHAKLMLNEKEMVLVSALRKIDEMSPHGRNVDVIFDMKQTASHALKDAGYK